MKKMHVQSRLLSLLLALGMLLTLLGCSRRRP